MRWDLWRMVSATYGYLPSHRASLCRWQLPPNLKLIRPSAASLWHSCCWYVTWPCELDLLSFDSCHAWMIKCTTLPPSFRILSVLELWIITAPRSRDGVYGIENNYTFGISIPYLPIHCATFIGLWWQLRAVYFLDNYLWAFLIRYLTLVVGCWRGYMSGQRCRFAYGPADATATHYLLLQ